MKKVIILTGLSGSGKSTFAQRFCLENANWLRVNRDDLRRSLLPVSLGTYWKTWPDQEKDRIETLVNELQKTAILDGLRRGWHVLIDNTNLRQRYFNDFRKLLMTHFDEVEVSYKLIDTPLDECIRRDSARPDSVGEDGIRRQAEQLATLKTNFRFEPEIVRRNALANDRASGSSLPYCVLVDIDGTVAQRGDRSPFDWHRVGIDTPKWPIIRLVQALKSSGYTIIFLSGRDAICRSETMAWLEQYFDWKSADYQLFMRPRNDNRKDFIVKHELFDQHIRDRYQVELVIDDRQQVVDLWRRTLKLTCVQVDYGDF
ncbi:phosphatase domain-containing protein [Spirosoma radiotolerans]|uniref:5'-hydroxyl kinase n=1 Tax=Spirosoma radiotolerans TaxID=1379870 RepID=A0A0E3V5Z9_9BACT|nr:AAA family ATPase [Spirosoma radiotolerans]AKD54597.1 5'-hydroxyl kinase [Spirosoma radiotolerans]